MNASEVDFELLPDVVNEVEEHLPQLENDLHRLVQLPNSTELLASAFRHMHTIKGDFGYCHATPIMEFVHHLEDVLQSLRNRMFQCSALVAEAMLQSLGQVVDMMQTLEETGAYDEIRRDALVDAIDQLAKAGNQAAADQAARHALMAVHSECLSAPLAWAEAAPALAPAVLARALALGEQLSGALVIRHPPWQGRVTLQLSLVQALNQHYQRPTASDSLAVAVHWHDVGLLAAPDRFFTEAPHPKSADWVPYSAHPEHAADWLLSIAPECTEAAQIIREHHRWANGSGIAPPGNKVPPHPGAQMLACADMLHERVVGLAGEDYRRGVLRAVFEVNAGLDTRFDATLINAFQAVARDFTSPPA